VKVVIIAAGMGSRLWGTTNKIPKTLLPFGSGTILSTIIGRFKSTGCEEFVIVVGFNASFIVEYLTRQEHFDVNIEIVDNPEWKRGNGLSVLSAQPAVQNAPFILSMSDHIVTPDAIRKISVDPSGKNLLLVDTRINEIYDIDDATKVYIDGKTIRGIGKDLNSYNAIDCGIFRLTERFFTAMCEQAAAGNESISAGITTLIETEDMEAVLLEPHHRWIDLDTPESYLYARGCADDFL
jgi:choline kinase